MNNDCDDIPSIKTDKRSVAADAPQNNGGSADLSEGKTHRRLKEVYVGPKFTIIHCKEALESYYEAMTEKSQKEKKIKSMENGLALLVERLGNGNQMSGESFPFEGDLPDGSKFRAFKKIPIRAYIWQSKRRNNVYYISHYKYKLKDELDPRDSDRVCRNWTRIEVDYEER